MEAAKPAPAQRARWTERWTREKAAVAGSQALHFEIQRWKEPQSEDLWLELWFVPKSLNSRQEQLLGAGVEHGHSEGA